MIYYIADTHFSDPNILVYSRTQFKNVDEMNKLIIENWNNTVTDDDVVYHLGDVGDYDLLNQLNGNIKVVLGNHDEESLLNKKCPNIRTYDKTIIDRYCILSHEPVIFIPKDFPMINIHGHLHQYNYRLVKSDNWYDGNRYFNCSCEQINYTPISEEEIMRRVGYKHM